YGGAFGRVFISSLQSFCYLNGNTYKKKWYDKFVAYFRKNLEWQVFHAHDIETSKSYVKQFNQLSSEVQFGIFVIPQGTKYYEGNNDDLGSFAIRYYGPLHLGNKHLILNQ